MAERVNEVMKTWGGIMLAFLQLITVAILAPWAWKITDAVNTLRGDMQENRAWHASHLQTVEVEKKSLKLEIEAETEKLMRTLLEKYDGKIDEVRKDIRATDMEVRAAGANVKTLQDTITQMSSRFSSLTADVRQALINSDFQRNTDTKKGQ